MSPPRTLEHPLFQLLRDERITEFNQHKVGQTPLDFRGADLRGLDLRQLDAGGIDFADAYFRGADLRGVDFRQSNLQGASIALAQISGCYFPDQIEASEILLSQQFGTRMRYRC